MSRRQRKPARSSRRGKFPRPSKSEELYQEPLPFEYRLGPTVIEIPFAQHLSEELVIALLPGSEKTKSRHSIVKLYLEEAPGCLLVFTNKAILVGARSFSNAQIWSPYVEKLSRSAGGPPQDTEPPRYPVPGFPAGLHMTWIDVILVIDIGFSIDLAKYHAHNYETTTYDPRKFGACNIALGDGLGLMVYEKGTSNLMRFKPGETVVDPIVAVLRSLAMYRMAPRAGLSTQAKEEGEFEELFVEQLQLENDHISLNIDQLKITDSFRSSHPNVVAARVEEFHHWLGVVGKEPQTSLRRRDRDSSPRRRARKPQPLSTTKLLAEIGFEVWSDCNYVWTKKTKNPSDSSVTEEIILKKLLDGKSFRRGWCFTNMGGGERLNIRITIPPIDTGVQLRWYRSTQAGNCPSKIMELLPGNRFKLREIFAGRK